MTIYQQAQVDWENQGALFAENFKDGKAHIDLQRFGTPATLKLYPGPGFGDLSHPTTNLMLELMQGALTGQIALDIGCGSGILSLAALLMGAKKAYGVDIDAEALLHAEKNADLNGLIYASFSRFLPTSEQGEWLGFKFDRP